MPRTETDLTAAIGREALVALRLRLMNDDVSDVSRVATAKTLLDRFMPKDGIELKRREADERNATDADALVLALIELSENNRGQRWVRILWQ
jgi:hypothetical protein